MAYVLVNSKEEEEHVQRLLDKKVPSHRQAYSDRTAWIMACLSELSYLRFNPLFSTEVQKDYFVENVKRLVGDEKTSSLVKLLDLTAYDHEQEKKQLESELALLKMELQKVFDNNGTQAIFVKGEEFVALAFRGTEAQSIKDIKADANASPTDCPAGGRIHSGFKEAYEHVSYDIQNTLDNDEYRSLPLFITGHSLGGALATVAAKRLSHQGGIAACYTFGSPRVGDDEWIAGMKTAVYRLVNAADCVTMLPPGTEIITATAWLSKFVPWIGPSLSAWLSKFGGYLHGGNMRYLTNCPKGSYSRVRLLYGVSFPYRIKGLLIKKLPWKKFLSDHSMKVYRQKLDTIADRRNLQQSIEPAISHSELT